MGAISISKWGKNMLIITGLNTNAKPLTCCLKFLRLKGNATAEEIDDTNGMNFKMQARLNEEFIVTVPISNEKAKVNTLLFELLRDEKRGLTNYLSDPM